MATKINFKTQVERDLKVRFDELLDQKKISLTNATEALLRLVVDVLKDEDDVARSMVLGQVEATPAVVKFVMRRLEEAAAKQRRREVGRDAVSHVDAKGRTIRRKFLPGDGGNSAK